jgi:galactokinase
MKPMKIDRNELERQFYSMFGPGDDIHHYFAPGRVNLIGEYTDFNGGYVFPCALTMGTYMLVRKRSDQKLRFYSLNFIDDGVITCDINNYLFGKENNWTAYPKGMFWTFQQNGYTITDGLDILVYGDIPNGSGLSSSASLEVVTGLMLADIYQIHDVSRVDLALMGQFSENRYNGMNCGIMDQFAIALGKKNQAIFLNTTDLSYKYVPLELTGHTIVIANSNKKRSLTESKYNERRAECEKALQLIKAVKPITFLCDLTSSAFEEVKDVLEDPVLLRRVRHTVYENERTKQAVMALENKDLETFGKLMNQSHISLRDDYEVTGKHLDTLVEEAWKCKGVLGSRMTGAGFGGCTVSVVQNEYVEQFVSQVGANYEKETGYHADFYMPGIGEI